MYTAIRGQPSVMVGDSVSYYCFTDCIPACNITWHFLGKTFTGNTVSVPIFKRGKTVLGNKLVIRVEDFYDTEPLGCTAVNILSGKSESITKTLRVSGKERHFISVHS